MSKQSLWVWVVLLAGLVFQLLGTGSTAWAYVLGYGPQAYRGNLHYGTGVYFAPYHFKVYAEPSFSASVTEEISWQSSSSNIVTVLSNLQHQRIAVNRVFLSYYPSVDVAMLAVLSENGQGWAEVIYDQEKQKTGWVPIGQACQNTDNVKKPLPRHFCQFQAWYDFMRLNAKANGIYWLTGVEAYHRSLRTAPEDTAKLIPVTALKKIKVKYLKGNWMLVEGLDFDRSAPIGWLRWRDEEGNLMVFPNFIGDQQAPMLMGF